MPYDVRQQGGKWVVAKKDGSKVFGSHESRVKAMKQRIAIIINEKK